MPYAEMSPDELRRRRAAGEDLVVLDVREDSEVADWAFPGAVHIPLGELATRAQELAPERPIVVLCHAGVRSAAAAEALDRAGWQAANLTGGVVAWRSSEPPEAGGS